MDMILKDKLSYEICDIVKAVDAEILVSKNKHINLIQDSIDSDYGKEFVYYLNSVYSDIERSRERLIEINGLIGAIKDQ